MPSLFFPDNTVLINFTHIDRHDVLEWFLRDQAAWTIATARECDLSSRQHGLEAMSRWNRVLPPPLIPEAAEIINAKTIAEQMRLPGETDPAKHMGEAEAIAVIVNRQIKAVYVTDDHDAARRAAAEPLISVASTTKILAFAEVMGRITHKEARNYLAILRNKRRVLGGQPSIARYDDYVTSLKRRRRT